MAYYELLEDDDVELPGLSLATIARDLFSLVARLYPNRRSGQPAQAHCDRENP